MSDEDAEQFGAEPQSEEPPREPPLVPIAYRVFITPCISATLGLVASQITPIATFVLVSFAVAYLLWYSARRELAPAIRQHILVATGLTYAMVIVAFAVVPGFSPAWTVGLITALWLLAAVILIRVVESDRRPYVAGRYLDIALASTGFSLVPWAIVEWFHDSGWQSFAVLMMAISMIPLGAERNSVARVLGTVGLASGCVLVGILEFRQGSPMFGAALVLAACATSATLLTKHGILRLLAQCAFGIAAVTAGAALASGGASLAGGALLIGGLAAVAYAAASRMDRPRMVKYSVGFGALSLVLLGIELVRRAPAVGGLTLIVLAVLILLLRSCRLASRFTDDG